MKTKTQMETGLTMKWANLCAAICALSMIGCKTEKTVDNKNLSDTAAAKPILDTLQQKNQTSISIDSTIIRKNCSVGEFNVLWLTSQLQRGANMDSLIGCETSLTFQQRRLTVEGDIIMLVDQRTGDPLVLVKNGGAAKQQISGRIYQNEPAIYLGISSYSSPNGNTYAVATFQLSSSISNQKIIGFGDLKLDTLVGKGGEIAIENAYILKEIQSKVPNEGFVNLATWRQSNPLISRMKLTKPCSKDQELLVCEGIRRLGDDDGGIFTVNMATGKFNAAIVRTLPGGTGESNWYGGEIKQQPEQIKSWLRNRGVDVDKL
mgnify:CR=1 FL=1